jgi:hypothetical protein
LKLKKARKDLKRKVKQALTDWTEHLLAEVNGKESSDDRRPLTPKDIGLQYETCSMGQRLPIISNHFDYVRINNLEVPTNFAATLKRILQLWSRT